MKRWRSLFDSVNVVWCEGCELTPYHATGVLIEDVMHWKRRRFTHAAARDALRVVVRSRHPEWTPLPPWQRVYLVNHEIQVLAARAHIRLPRNLFDLERAELRFQLGGYTNEMRRRMTPSEQADFKAALRWAARS